VIRALFVVSLALLTACAGPEKPKSSELGPNTALLGVRAAWSSAVGPVDFPLDIRVVGDSVFVAASGGTVVNIDSRTGLDVWRLQLKETLAAGVGTDGKYVAVVSRENEVQRAKKSGVTS
jgi:outer membrane protein assembly factor BamB